jgi:hypothetical protein
MPATRPRQPASTRPSGATTDSGFAYSREQFCQIVEDVLAMAAELGASDAAS